MRALGRALLALPILARAVLVGALIGAGCGGIAGLILGLLAYPPTAWFAVIEVGFPAAVAGALIGLLGGVALVVHDKRHSRVRR